MNPRSCLDLHEIQSESEHIQNSRQMVTTPIRSNGSPVKRTFNHNSPLKKHYSPSHKKYDSPIKDDKENQSILEDNGMMEHFRKVRVDQAADSSYMRQQVHNDQRDLALIMPQIMSSPNKIQTDQ